MNDYCPNAPHSFPMAGAACIHCGQTQQALAEKLPSPFRARTITTREGTFINIDDVKTALNNDEFVKNHLIPVLKVGHDKTHNLNHAIRVTVFAAIYDLIIP